VVWPRSQKNKIPTTLRGQDLKEEIQGEFRFIDDGKGGFRRLTKDEIANPQGIDKSKLFRTNSAVSPGIRANTTGAFEYKGMKFDTGPNRNWKTVIPGMLRLAELNRLTFSHDPTRLYKQFWDDFPCIPLTNAWLDVRSEQDKTYVVQTVDRVIERCVLMTTDPGDLVFDPTCGSGTTAFVAEQWGRRWITCDTSRVATTLAKQRLMSATFDYYKLAHPDEGVGSGLQYKKVPHVTLKSIANNEPPGEETLYDQPHTDNSRVRVSGPFTVEAVPAPTVKPVDDLAPTIDIERPSQTGHPDTPPQNCHPDPRDRSRGRAAEGSAVSSKADLYIAEIRGFDYFNTRTGAIESGGAEKIAMWLLDTDYDGRSLYPRQVFFPMADETEGWAKLARNLKAEIDPDLIEAYRGTISLPFQPGEHKRVAVKVIDDRGIESLKVVPL
jgi:hypothetical protein